LNENNNSVSGTEQVTNPLLIQVPHDFEEYKFKIMIFGQETNGWCDECGNDGIFSSSIEKSMKVYDEFVNKEGFLKYNSPFWQVHRHIKSNINSKEETVFIYNNINKIGRMDRGSNTDINKLQFEYFNVIGKELDLIKPDVMLFFTGPKYLYLSGKKELVIPQIIHHINERLK